MVEVKYISGCDDLIVTSHKPSGVLLLQLFKGVLYELKMVKYFFVKSEDLPKLQSCSIERRLVFLRFGYAWSCMAHYVNIGMCICPESVG